MGQEQTQAIQVINFTYDTSHWLTKVIYRGREAVVATELGRFLGYTNNGSRLVQMITSGRRSWTERFREGVDYEMLQGQDLQEFLEILSHGERVNPKFSHLMIFVYFWYPTRAPKYFEIYWDQASPMASR